MTDPSPPSPPEPAGEPDARVDAEVAMAVTSAAAPEPVGGAAGYRVALPTFEGPLDLLLHLIEEHELDIFDIPIAFVAAKFVEYVTLMQELNIDVASEYLVMAATLAHIKSKMLLPPSPDEQEEEQELEIDPRAELVRRLLEYQKYKQAAETLSGAPVLGRDVFLRGVPGPDVEGRVPIAGLSLFRLLDAFQVVLSRAKASIDHQIDLDRFSITDRINQISELLRRGGRIAFVDLFEGQSSRSELIVTFLALLEMTRLRLTKLFQDDPLGPIEVELAVSPDEPNSELAADASAGDFEAENTGDLEDGNVGDAEDRNEE